MDKKDVPKINNMLKSLDAIPEKKREDIVNDKFEDPEEIVYDSSETQAVDVVASFKCSDISISYSSGKLKVKLFSPCMCWKAYGDALKTHLKAFRGQCGSYGSPSGDKKKYADKVDEIYAGVNGIAEMITEVRGAKLSYKKDDLKSVDGESVKLITSHCC